MNFECPACGRTTRVAREQLDFVVRCERCRTLLLARSGMAGGVGGMGASEQVRVEPVQLAAVAENLRTAASLHFEAKRDWRAQGRRVATEKRRRASFGMTTMCVLVGVGLLGVGGAIFGMSRWVLRPGVARGTQMESGAAAVAVAVEKAAVAEPQARVSHVSGPAERGRVEAAAGGDGDLFPEVAGK